MKTNNFIMPSPQEMQTLINFCTVMSDAPFYKKLSAGGVMAIFLTAKEYDLPFMACLNGGLNTFDGKVTFSAIMIDSLILKSGHKTEVLKLDYESCRIRFTRGDRQNDRSYKPFDFEYTFEMAKNAGYTNKTNWKNSPLDMLYCRCLTGGGRKHCPEVFVGVMFSGELTNSDSDSEEIPNLNKNSISYENQKKEFELQKEKPKIENDFKGFDDVEKFKKRHNISEGEKIYDYVINIANTKGIDAEQVLRQGFLHEEKFIESFKRFELSLNH